MAVASASRRQQYAEATRAALLRAAETLIAERGYADVSIDEICVSAGVTKGALYHHFGSKEGLVEAVYKEAIRRHAERVVAASAEGTGRARLLALVDASARLYASRTPFYRVLIALHLAAAMERPALADIARRMQRTQRDFMIGLVREGQRDGSIRPGLDAEAVGLTVNAALEGFLTQQLEPPAQQRRWVAKFRSLLGDLL
jgi:AcrR family transcriptional regulator